jgi:hypothetical protein
MRIQHVNHSIKINRLPAFLHPLDHAGSMVTPETHARQFLNQFSIGMVAKEL